MRHNFVFGMLILSFLVTACGSPKKTEEKKIVTKENMLDGLHKPAAYSGIPTHFFSKEIPVYTENAVLLPRDSVENRNKSGKYMSTPYVNDKNEMVLWVSKLLTEEQKKQMYENKNAMNIPSKIKGKKAPFFNVTDIKGNNIALEKLKGKIVVINFWFISCKPCIEEMDELNELVDQCKERDVVFLGFALDKKDALLTFLKQRPFNYTIIPDTKPIATLYDIMAYPSNLVIDQNGIVTYHTTGLDSNAPKDMLAEIERLEKKISNGQ